jgi:hypothetical protein
MSLPAQKNISIYKGDSYTIVFTLKDPDTEEPVDLTGVEVAAEIRATEDAGSALATFTCGHDDDGGTVTLELSPAETTALTVNGVWDVQLTFTDGWVQTYLKGSVTLVKEVTRV